MKCNQPRPGFEFVSPCPFPTTIIITPLSIHLSILHRKQCLINRERRQHATSKAWTAIDSLSAIWESDLTDKIKCSFFQAAVTSILLYGCSAWTLTKRMEKKLDGNYTRMLRAILNKSWRQNPTKQQLYGYLPSITKTIQVWRTRHAGHCWRCKDELLRTPSHGRAKAGRLARTYIQPLCADTGYYPEDPPGAMYDRDGWQERGSGRSELVARQENEDDDLYLFFKKSTLSMVCLEYNDCFPPRRRKFPLKGILDREALIMKNWNF